MANTITYKQAVNLTIDYITANYEDFCDTVENPNDVLGTLEKLQVKVTKEKGKGEKSDARLENEAYLEQVVEQLQGTPNAYTCAKQVAECLGLRSTQKGTAILRLGVTLGVFEKMTDEAEIIEVTGRNEKNHPVFYCLAK